MGLSQRFPDLSANALTVLTVSHSNAAEERVFSVIRKNKIEFRARLGMEGSLNSIMSMKIAQSEDSIECHERQPSKKLLIECKRADNEYNASH